MAYYFVCPNLKRCKECETRMHKPLVPPTESLTYQVSSNSMTGIPEKEEPACLGSKNELLILTCAEAHLKCGVFLSVDARGAWSVPGHLFRGGSDLSCSLPGLLMDLLNTGLSNLVSASLR